MKVLVPVKRVVDPYVKVHVKSDHSGMAIDNLKMAMNPFDEIALEEAIRLKEKGVVNEIVAVTVGDKSTQETLRHALALGADEAIQVETAETLEPLGIAKVLAAMVATHKPDCVLMGKQAIDDDCNQTGQMLAGLLDWPQATFISALNIDKEQARVVREVDGGLETLTLPLPAVITTDLRLNEPRYPALPNIMKAKRKPLAVVSLDSLGLDTAPRLKTLNVTPPPERKPGRMLESVEQLVDILHNQEKVI